MKLLIAQPASDLATALAKLFEIEGHESVTATSFAEVERILGQDSFDVLILDRYLEDGGILTNLQRPVYTDQRIVLFTSEDDPRFLAAARDTRIETVFSRPEDLRQLAAYVNHTVAYA